MELMDLIHQLQGLIVFLQLLLKVGEEVQGMQMEVLQEEMVDLAVDLD